MSAASPEAAAIGAAGSIGGSIISGLFKKKAAKKQFKRTKYLRSTAYQATMKDMKLAGLNPILAYKQGATAAGAAQMAQVPDFGEAMTRGMQAGVSTAKEKREAETATPLRKAQQNVYGEQLENLAKEGRLLDQRFQSGEATAVESMLRAEWMMTPEGIRSVIRNYIGGPSVTGRAVAEGTRIGKELWDAIPTPDGWYEGEGEGRKPVDPNKRTSKQGPKKATGNRWPNWKQLLGYEPLDPGPWRDYLESQMRPNRNGRRPRR